MPLWKQKTSKSYDTIEMPQDLPRISTNTKVCNRKMTIALVTITMVGLVSCIVGLSVGLPINLPREIIELMTPKTTPAPRPIIKANSSSPLGVYRFAAVAADAGVCSTVGAEIMAIDGGSAVDSAIATLLCMGVINAHSMGIGGGGFMVIYDRKRQEVTTLDSRETAPGFASTNMFVGRPGQPSLVGGEAIGVPGEIAGYWEAHKRFGKLPWAKLFEPTIKLCTEGFPMASPMFKAIIWSKLYILADPTFRERFMNESTGSFIRPGENMTCPMFAKTLQLIADEGASTFYNGSLAKLIVQEIQAAGGNITLRDLREYRVKAHKPSTIKLNNGKFVHSMRPPSSGVVLQYILNIIDGFNFTAKSNNDTANSTLSHHRIIEAFKYAYAERTRLGDEDFVDVKKIIANLTSDEFAEMTRLLINDSVTFPPSHYKPEFSNYEDHGTGHLSLLAPNGDAVSVTSTINTYFGSKVIGNYTGIIYNNEMDDFSTPNLTNTFGLPPSPANFIKPGKRPMSSMAPMIMTDNSGEVRLVLGASGGSRITTGVAYTAVRAIWFNETIKEAIDARRVHHQLVPNYVSYETDFPLAVKIGLESIGHLMMPAPLGRSVVQGIARGKDGLIYANSDFRKGGKTDGF